LGAGVLVELGTVGAATSLLIGLHRMGDGALDAVGSGISSFFCYNIDYLTTQWAYLRECEEVPHGMQKRAVLNALPQALLIWGSLLLFLSIIA
jgi:hypothetical protein